MKVELKDSNGTLLTDLEIGFEVIEDAKGNQAVHDAVVAYMAAQRSGTACTKTRGDVRGSNKKPWRQKGTGRARAGERRSPIWTGGGVAHGPKPRDFRKKVNKRTRQLALRRALSERLAGGDVIIIDRFGLEAPKTKAFVAVLEALGLDYHSQSLQLVVDANDSHVALASRNVLNVALTDGQTLNTYDVLRSDKLVFTREAFDQVQQRLNNQ